MDFRCVCGKVLSMDVAPGAVVQCPACGQRIQVPGAAPQAPPPAPPPYPYPPPYVPSAPTRTCGQATAALVLGLLGLIFSVLTAIPAIILGAVALSKIKRSQGELGGSGLAVAGLIIGSVMTLFGFVALSVVALTVLTVPGLVRAREPAQMAACSDNLRNLNLAIFQYFEGNHNRLPSADRNIYAALAPHLGDPAPDGAGSDVWRCPSDPFIPSGQRLFWCSYAPNASVEETDIVIGAFGSNHKLENRIYSAAPDTISFIEMWTPPNVVPGHPGFLLKLNDPNRSMIVPGQELVAIRSYRTARPVKFDADGRLTDCGNYLFLRAFLGQRTEDMYHRGRINVGFIDGHVSAVWIKDLVHFDRPADNPVWTRDAD